MFSAGLENRGKRGLLIDNKVCRRHAGPPPTTSGEQVLMLGVREGERGGFTKYERSSFFSKISTSSNGKVSNFARSESDSENFRSQWDPSQGVVIYYLSMIKPIIVMEGIEISTDHVTQ